MLLARLDIVLVFFPSGSLAALSVSVIGRLKVLKKATRHSWKTIVSPREGRPTCGPNQDLPSYLHRKRLVRPEHDMTLLGHEHEKHRGFHTLDLVGRMTFHIQRRLKGEVSLVHPLPLCHVLEVNA